MDRFRTNQGTCVLYATHSSLLCIKLKNKPVSSLVSFSLTWDKTKTSDKINGKYIIWAIILHIKGGLKYLGSLKLENNSYFIIFRIIVPYTFCMQTSYSLPPPPPLMCKYLFIKYFTFWVNFSQFILLTYE
jgi:hypothetical protein